MKILVTGVAGFIGSKTAELLLKQGHEVVGVDNLNDYYDIRLKRFRLAHVAKASGADEGFLGKQGLKAPFSEVYTGQGFQSDSFIFECLDIEDKSAVMGLGERHPFDAVINLAARAGVRYSMDNPHVYMATNASGTLNLLEMMRHHQIEKFILASTSSLYAGQKMPFLEELPVNTPISPYAATKKAAEAMAYTYHHLFGIDVSVVRYFTVFGPAGRPDMAPYRFIKWIYEGTPIILYGDGEQSRDFTYIDDIAEGTIAALQKVGYSIFNLGGGNNPISINTTIDWIESFFDRKAVIDHKPFHKADMRVTFADIEKAKRELGWSPKTGVKEGFEQTAQWYLDHHEWLSGIPV